MADVDDDFYNRADEVIGLANQQLAKATRGKVSASTMYAVARFNAWITACGHASGDAMEAAKAETIEYFVHQYREMLLENLNDYIRNHGKYFPPA